MKKTIKVKFTSDLCFKITDQTHVNKEFGLNSSYFVASSGFRLESSSFPEIMTACHGGSHGIYVRGDDESSSGMIVKVPGHPFRKALEQAIKEYNEHEF